MYIDYFASVTVVAFVVCRRQFSSRKNLFNTLTVSHIEYIYMLYATNDDIAIGSEANEKANIQKTIHAYRNASSVASE